MSKTYLPLALLAGLSLSSSLLAQPWEKAYGPRDSKDEGHRRVAQVTQCPGGGYIAIGSRDVGAVSRVYLVRTNTAGARIWEHDYDLGFDGQPDEGLALAELRDGSGFVTTGTSQRGLGWHAHVLRVSCDGGIVFSKFYYPQFTTISPRVVGNDIREATVGNGVDTFPGDLLVAGHLASPNGIGDAMLLRLDAAGNLVWHRRYDTGATERFFGLTEARANASGGGDIIAVGDWTDGGRSQALVLRASGNDGSLAGGDHCMAIYGDAGAENFQSVVELRLAPNTGALVMAGMSSSPGQAEDVYLVETKPNPCSMIAQNTIGNEFGFTYREWATDLVEVLQPVDASLGVPLGALALTGYAENGDSVGAGGNDPNGTSVGNPPGAAPGDGDGGDPDGTSVGNPPGAAPASGGDAFLLFAKEGSLFPITARTYGDHRGAVDFGSSLSQLRNVLGPINQPRGFIIAGTTLTDWGDGDPADLYLVQPNAKASTGCEQEWFPYGAEWRWEPRRLDPHIDKVVTEEAVHTDGHRDDTVLRICQ